ncbi:hypothetical protein NIES73_47420 [Sphaerospermopsis kisseleviana NIES-73]|nr:hypothetical protein NIES73_47420 [Sphaerospermopsis kisseleviana NIES-73]
MFNVDPASILKLPVLVPPEYRVNVPALTWTVPVLLKSPLMEDSPVVVPLDLISVPALLKVDRFPYH